MKSNEIHRILVRKKRIERISSLDLLIKVETNYCIDEIVCKTSLLENKYDENILHEIRISLRKLKSLIYFFKGYLLKKDFTEIKNIIHNLIAPTSKARDYDVVKANYIYPICLKNKRNDDYKTFMIHSINEIHYLQEETLNILSSQKYLTTLMDLKTLVNKYSWDNQSKLHPDSSLRKYVENNINKELRAIYSNIKDSYNLPRKKLHHLRIRIKEIRYVTELLKFYIKKYKTTLRDLKVLQDILGEINDTYAADSIIHDLNISKYLSSQHKHIEKKILKHRNSSFRKLKHQI